MEEDVTKPDARRKIIKTSTVVLLGIFLIILIVVAAVVYNWQHHKVTSLQQHVKTLNTQLQYVQGQQDKLEKQIH